MPDIVISEFIDADAVARLSARYDTHYDATLVDRPDDLAAAVAGARALIVRNRTKVRGAVLEAGQRLTCIGRLGVGLDNIDVAACEGRGIAVYPATGANDVAVAEYVITAALVLLRGAWAASAEVAAGAWPRQRLIGREVSGKTLGLVGFGGIARQTAGRARSLEMQVIAADPYLDPGDAAWQGTGRCDLAEVFARADVVSLHVPLTEGTRHLVDAARLATMRPGAILINAARGGVVDEAALAEALRAGQIAGAALDVFETEPLTAAAGARFQGLNVLLTPHIAGVTDESNVRVSTMIADRVLAHLG